MHLSIFGQRSRFLGKHLRHPSCILDLGCGGGNEQLKGTGSYVVGVDVSRGSLRRAMEIYDEVYQASAVALPFGNGSFDTVVCLDMFGHLPVAKKGTALAEMSRVLCSKRTMIHLVEVDASGGLFKYAKRHPDLYERYFIDLDGHHGLESPTAVVQRYAGMGFSVQEVRHFAKVCWCPGEYAKRFGNEYSRRSRLLRVLAGPDRRLAVGGWRTAATAILLQGICLVVEPLLPMSYCGLLGLYCVRC